MGSFGKALSIGLTLGVAFIVSASDQKTEAQQRGPANAPAGGNAPSSIPMGGNKSVTRFFVTSKGLGKGGDLGGIAGADAHCQMLTGSRPDGTAFPGNAQRTCNNWTSSGTGSAQVGYSDRSGQGDNPNSWNSAHPTSGCSEEAFRKSGGAGLLYCFAID